MQHDFFVIDQAIRKPSAIGLTYDLGHATHPHAALSTTETVYQDDHILASDTGYCSLPSDPSGPTPYPPRVQEAFAVDATVNLDPSASAVGASWGSIQLANNDNKYDSIVTGGWVADGHDTRILYGTKQLEAFDGFKSGSSTGGTWVDRNNTVQSSGPAVVRQDYATVITLDAAATNSVLNSIAAGAVAGTIGSGGVAPTGGWVIVATGLAIELSAYGTPLAGGIANVLRLRFHGTTGGGAGAIYYATSGGVSGLQLGQSVAQSVFVALVAGAFTNVTQVVHQLLAADATGAAIGTTQPNIMASITNTLTRFSRAQSMPLAGAIPFTTGNASLVFYWPTGVAIDFTIDIAAPQVELGTVATPFIATSAGEVTHGDGAVNYLLHTDMSGAVAGTPGTLPTGWALALGAGVSQQVVAVGTDAVTGLKYIDLRLFGTPTSTQTVLTFGAANAIDATTGQAWCPSVYAQFTAGSQTGATFQLGCREYDSTPTMLRFGGETASPLSVNVVSRSRRIAPFVTTATTTRYVQPYLLVNYASGVALNVTFRLMAPQLEGGAVATAFIQTIATPASRPATYTMTGLPVSLNEPDATNYVRTGSPGVSNVTIAASTEVPTVCSAVPVWKHLRTATGTDSNSGTIGVVGLPSTGGSIRGSAWLWIPSSLASTKAQCSISLEGNTTGFVYGSADLTLRDQWQRVSCTANLTAGATATNLVLRILPQLAGDVVYTSAWQVEIDIGAMTSFIVPGGATPTLRAADGLYTARNILVDPPFASLVPAFVGVAGALSMDDTKMSIPLRDASYWLERPLLRSTYGGNALYDGTLELAGTLKPLIIGGSVSGTTRYGPVHNVTPVLVDPAALIYQVSDGAIGGIAALYEGGYAGGITFAGDVPDLYTGGTPSGQYRTCLARGCFQLGSNPIHAITCDVNGAAVPGSNDATPLAVAAYALLSICGVPPNLVGSTGVLGAVGATLPITSGCAVFLGPQDSPSGIDLMTRILAPAAMKLVACRDGILRAFVIASLPSAAPVKAALDSRNIVSVTPIALPSAIDPAPYRIRVGYNANYTVQTTDLSPLATTARTQYLATDTSIAQANSPSLSNAIIRPNDPPVIGASLVDHRTVTAVSAAMAAARQYVALWGVRRRLYGVEVPFAVGVGLEYGDVVTIATDIADFSGVTKAQVVGYSYRTEDASITLRVLV
jgi:hypothetical protein